METKNTTQTDAQARQMIPLSKGAQYLGLSKSWVYKLTMARKIPHYKPNGKCIYFDRAELDEWLHSNRVQTAKELTKTAQDYCKKM